MYLHGVKSDSDPADCSPASTLYCRNPDSCSIEYSKVAGYSINKKRAYAQLLSSSQMLTHGYAVKLAQQFLLFFVPLQGGIVHLHFWPI